MRRLFCQVFKLCVLFGGILLLEMPQARGETVPAASPSVAQPPLMECNFGGPNSARASQEFAQGSQLAAAGDARCVDWFFASALTSWADLNEGLTQKPPRLLHGSLQLYNSAVLSAVVSGHRFGRLNPANGLQVVIEGRLQTIPVVKMGLLWELDQIDCLQPATCHFQNPTFARTVKYGVGATLLGLHFRRDHVPGEEHFMEEHPFAITAVLRGDGRPENCRLEFYDPAHRQSAQVAGRELALSRNIAAAVEYAVTHLEADVNPLTAFFNPEIAVNYEGVLMFQPYQKGKIPIVLVHGLLSNPATWGAMVNDYLNNPELMKRFQLFAYLYPTSVPFVQTAAELRRDLRNVLAFYDPDEQDPALRNMMLIGHSMGGLIARLQVTWSGDHLWNEFANVPFGQIIATPENRQRIAEIFFFGPQPFVKRAVFIAVPHRGPACGAWFLGLFGRIVATLPVDVEEVWTELRRLNRGILRSTLGLGLPTSVSGLSPNSPSLRGVAKLPFAPWVHLHSIIGTRGCPPCCSGDSVVPIKSARLAGVESEVFVDATHFNINEHPDTIREVERLLWIHWDEFKRQSPVEPPASDASAPAVSENLILTPLPVE